VTIALRLEESRSDRVLEDAVIEAERLVAAAQALAIAFAELDDLSLPPLPPREIDEAELRAIAGLYLTAEMEGAGVIPGAEDLVRLARSGALRIDLGDAGPLLQNFWSERHQRVSESERQAFFAQLFGPRGGPSPTDRQVNDRFEDRMIDLCEALYKMDLQATNPSWGGVAQQARVRAAAQGMLYDLLQAAGGITLYFAQEILRTMKDSLTLLNHPAVRAAFQARTLWDVITAIDRQFRRRRRDPVMYVRRGKAGMTVLAWLADAAPFLDAGQPLLGLEHPVIGAAVEWLEVSLALSESGQPEPRYNEPVQASPWSALAG
jgi:hypothetical protein